MPQLVKKRRSGWAVLAAGALVASLLAVGATPAAAVERNVDDPSVWRACLGDAASTDHVFTDVSTGGSHGTNINCLAYYGVTTGKTADTFAPNDSVTRSQMALFLARSADAANIDLGDTMDEGFNDIAGLSAEKRDAINRLVAKGIMFGDTVDSFDPPSTTRFAPYDNVMRWEMAMFLFAFLDLALDSVLIDQVPARIDGDGTGHIELNDVDGDGQGEAVDDYFRDARRETPAHVDDAIGALYELGVTTGTNNAIGEAGVFNPNGLVTRAQMASFIMRALGHTNLRPAGVTAQSTNTRTQVSLRNADFDPVVDAKVEVISSSYPTEAFNSDGECVTDPPYVVDEAPSFDTCRIDVGDEQTDAEGNAEFRVGIGGGGRAIEIACTGSDPNGSFSIMAANAPDASVWAWTGTPGTTVDSDTDLALAEAANTVDETSEATQAVITGGTMNHIRMGSTVTYVVQLKDAMGNKVGPTPGKDYGFTVTTLGMGQNSTNGVANADADQVDGETDLFEVGLIRTPETKRPDSNGRFTVTVGYPDPARFTNDPDVEIQLQIQRSALNEIAVNDMTMGTAITDTLNNVVTVGTTTPNVRFSDNNPYADDVKAETVVWRLLNPDGANRNTVTLSVTDQYGNLLTSRNQSEDLTTDDYFVDAASSATGTIFSQSTVSGGTHFALPNSGRESLSYNRESPAVPLEETITVRGSEDSSTLGDDQAPATDERLTSEAKLLWSDRATWSSRTTRPTKGTSSGTDLPVLLLATGSNHILVHQPLNADGVNGFSNVDVAHSEEPRPMAYRYGSDDSYFVEGVSVTYDQFQQIVSSMLVSVDRETTDDTMITTLTWDRFDYGIPEDRAVWRLEGIQCADPSTAGSGGAD